MTAVHHRTQRLTSATTRTAILLRERADLKHLIFSMLHDKSLDAQESAIQNLQHLLESIDQQLRKSCTAEGEHPHGHEGIVLHRRGR